MLVCPGCSAPCQDGHRYCFSCGTALDEVQSGANSDPFVGGLLPGGYRVTHLIGVGGMGRVYGAEQVALGRTVAVKVVHPHLSNDETTAARFLIEARAASRLGHPNSVAIFDFGRTQQGFAYIVMEYLRGRDLGRVASEDGPLPLARVVDVLRQTLAALAEAHAIGIVHRDLKPDNIVIEPLHSGLDFVKVVDFGLAKMLEPDGAGAGQGPRALTRPGLVCGTPEYMSPEHGRGDPLDGRSDLYSVGVVLFELLTGSVPFTSDSATRTLLMHLTDPVPDPRALAPDRRIPESLAEICVRALSKTPQKRFQDAGELSNALERAWFEVEPRPSNQPAPTSTVQCRSCGAANALGQRFCGECGAAAASTPPNARRAGASSKPTASAPIETPSGRSPALPLLERSEALEWLERRRREGEAMFATARLVGEAGAGKTRLVTEFLDRREASGDLVVRVRPDPTWAKVAEAGVIEAIRMLAAFPPGLVDSKYWDEATREARAALEVLFTAHPVVPCTASERRRSIAAALRWALERASERAGSGTVLLAVDDLDYVDGTSRNAFVDVLAQPPTISGLILVTVAAYSPSLGHTLPGEQLHLKPLSASSVASHLPSSVTPSPLLPLHLEQLLAWARESSEPAPARLADLLVARIDRLSADARQVIHGLAVWGDDATYESLRGLLPSTVDLDAAVDALDRTKLVDIDDAGIRIAHPLTRRVIFSSIPAGRKRELFSRAAEMRPDAPLEVRARQAMHGGSAFEALALLDAVAARRASYGDGDGCVSSLRHALDVARREMHRGELDDPVEAVLVFARKLAEALVAVEKWVDAEGVLREAVDNAPPASRHRAQLLGALAQVAHARRHPSEARRYLDEAMRAARQSDARALIPVLEELDKSIAVA